MRMGTFRGWIGPKGYLQIFFTYDLLLYGFLINFAANNVDVLQAVTHIDLGF